METLFQFAYFQAVEYLETFLRGMETVPQVPGGGPCGCLETFLRGMETALGKPELSCVHALKPSLEGWKPSMRYVLLLGSSCLETFLRGMETDSSHREAVLQGLLETFLRGMETLC